MPRLTDLAFVRVGAIAFAMGLAAAAPAEGSLELELSRQANASFSLFPRDELFGVRSVAVGDVNGDGLADLATPNPGDGYAILFGRRRISRLAGPGLVGYRVRDGRVLGSAGDANGDGVDDLVVQGGRAAKPGGTTYVVFGRRGGRRPDIEVGRLAEQGYAIQGAPGDNAGTTPDNGTETAAGVGDVNGDSRDDVLISAVREDGRGYAAVVFGRSGSGTVQLGSLGAAGYRIERLCAGYYSSGHSEGYNQGPLSVAVSPAGDVNRDGLADIVLGMSRADDINCGGRGHVLVLAGKRDTRPIDGSAPGAGALVISGRGGTGAHVDGGKDVDGNGRPDLVVSMATGAVIVTDARPGRPLSVTRPGRRGWLIGGTGEADEWPPVLLGDMTGDGRSEIAMGSYVLRSGRTRPPRSLQRLGRRGYILRKTDSNVAGFGAGPARAAGDVNGDRRADLVTSVEDIGPPDVHLVLGNGPPLVEVAPYRSRILVDRRGRARVSLLCPANVARACSARLVLRTRAGLLLARRRIRLAAGATRSFEVRLPRRIRSRLRQGSLVNARSVIVARSGDGKRATVRRALPLLAARPAP